MFLDDIQTAARMGSRAAQFRDGVMKKSIAASAEDSIFQFPALVSNVCPVNMAVGITKLLDRTYASFVLMVLSQIANVDISLYRTPVQFLKSVHQNMRLENASEDEEDLESVFENFYDGKAAIAVNHHRHIAVVFEGVRPEKTNVKRLNYEATKEFLSGYDLNSVTMTEAPISREDMVNSVLDNAAKRTLRDDISLRQKISSGHSAPTLMDRDVKKANDMQPYALQVRMNVINENNEFVEYWDVVVGVKTVLHLIKSDEIIENIVRVVQNRGVLFNMIRWTTGEISFIKDLLLHIDDIKFDEANRAKGYSAWFPTLKRLKDKKLTVRDFKVNQVVPNASLVISSADVDVLEQRYGINVKDTAIATKLMDKLFLMTFVILDDATQTIDIMYNVPKGRTFETYAMETLEREVSLSSNNLSKEIGRIITGTR